MTERAQVQSYAKKLAKADLGPNKMATPQSSRERLRRVVKIFSRPSAKFADISEREVEGPAGPIKIRIYEPKAKAAKDGGSPLVAYYHGGGWIVGDLDLSHEALLMLSNLAGAVIVSVDYRLAPEHKFPTGLEDCYAATQWAVKNAKELGADPKKLVVCGESAGGNLAAAMAHLARKRKGPKIALQVLVYPEVDMVRAQSTYTDTEVGKLTMSAKEMLWMRDNYLSKDQMHEVNNPLISPLLGDLKGLPPALILAAENDPLTQQDGDYAKKLRKAGVKARFVVYPDAIHGFWNFPSFFDSGNDAVHRAARAIKKL